MAFKMKGNPMQRNFPNDIKPAPTKWINFIISGISAVAGAAKKRAEEQKAKREEAQQKMKDGIEGTKKKDMGDETSVSESTAPKATGEIEETKPITK